MTTDTKDTIADSKALADTKDQTPVDDKGKQPEAPYRPEGLPDHLVGKNEKETLDKVFKAYGGARNELAGKKGIPDKVDDYKLDLPEEISKVLIKPGDDGKDPVWEHMRTVFHKRGITSEDAVAIVGELVSQFPVLNGEGAAGEGEAGVDFDYKSLGGTDKAKPIVDGATVFLDGLKNSGKLSEKAVAELKILTTFTEGLTAVNELRGLLGDKAVPITLEGQNTDEGDITEAKLNEMMQDPKYWKEKDPAYIDQVTKGFQQLYGQKAT